MFWSGNYILMREVKLLLKEENVTLTQILEADDVLQECRADNKALIQFLTRPDIRAELITLVTEEPPKNVEISAQYRHANIASEVLTSQLSMLRDHLATDTVQMNRLCDFVNKDPPLNPLLATYFSKTIEMLLVKSPKQNWYAHHIACLQVLDFFKARKDFLPNLLRHISTSAICDVFKCFLHLIDFSKSIIEWFNEYQCFESFIQIICGTYEPEEMHHYALTQNNSENHVDMEEKGVSEQNEKSDINHKDDNIEKEIENNKGVNSIDGTNITNVNRNGVTEGHENHSGESRGSNDEKEDKVEDSKATEEKKDSEEASNEEAEIRKDRLRAVAAANAASLLGDIAMRLCAHDLLTPNSGGFCLTMGACAVVGARLRSAAGVSALLQAAYTAPARAAHYALPLANTLLLRLLAPPPPHLLPPRSGEECPPEEEDETAVERAVAPHVPLLHNTLLRPPRNPTTYLRRRYQQQQEETSPVCGVEGVRGEGVGGARVAAAAVLARLAASAVPDVLTALLSLGTAGVLLQLMFDFPDNNFLHAHVYSFVRNALQNTHYSDTYAEHLMNECKLLTRLIDVFEENEEKTCGSGVRAGYMGHVMGMLRELDALEQAGRLPAPEPRWPAFRDHTLRPHLLRLDTPLGGSYPSENQYEDESIGDLSGSYDLAEGVEGVEGVEGLEPLEGAPADDDSRDHDLPDHDLPEHDLPDHTMEDARNSFLELANQRFDDDMWDDNGPDVLQQVLADVSPWAGCEGGAAGAAGEVGEAGEAGWAHFDAFATAWPNAESSEGGELEQGMAGLSCADSRLQDALTIELAHKMLSAFSEMGVAPPADPPADPPAVPPAPPAAAEPAPSEHAAER